MGSTVGFCSFCTQHEIAKFSPWRPSLPPSLKPKQRLLLILTSTATEDMDWDTDTVSEDTTVDTVLATTASVRPRLSPRLLLILTFTATAAMGWDTDMEDTTADTVLATTASVRPKLSPRLPLIPGTTEGTDMVDTDSGLMDLDTDTVDSTTESKISLRPD